MACASPLCRLKDSDADLARLRGEIDQIMQGFSRSADALRPMLGAARKQVESLGAPPAKDAPPEAPAVAAERERIGAIVANLDGALKTIDLNDVRSRELIKQITEQRQALFARNLLRSTRSPLTPYHWERAARDFPATIGFAQYLAQDWIRTATPVMPQLIAFVFAALLAFAGLTFGVRRLVRQTDRPPADGRTFFERAHRIAWVAPARTLPTSRRDRDPPVCAVVPRPDRRAGHAGHHRDIRRRAAVRDRGVDHHHGSLAAYAGAAARQSRQPAGAPHRALSESASSRSMPSISPFPISGVRSSCRCR